MADESLNEGRKKPLKRIPSNEEVIQEVMKGVESYLHVKSDELVSENDMSYRKTEPKAGHSSGVENVASEHLEDSEEATANSNNLVDEDSVNDDDFIDESHLKDLEVGLSDVEKEQLRSEAEVHKIKGNDLFKLGVYKDSISCYTEGLRTCPLAFPKERSILYSNRAAAKIKLDLKPGAIEDCTKAVELDPSYLKARLRRAQLYEETDKLDEALADYQEILKIDASHGEALYASRRLPEKIQERNEKMKAEMLGKLKDLGNLFLRPFNLSTDNFQVNQDPSTGSYSVNFKSNTQQ